MKTQSLQEFCPNIKFIKSIGSGAFGEVFLAFDSILNSFIAVKKISCFGLTDYQIQLVINQAKILSSLQHSNIISFHSCVLDNAQESVYILMQYASDGDLLSLIQKARQNQEQIKQKLIWQIICDLSQGLLYLHNNRIIHRDIKPANILKQGQTYKIADMNVSKIQEKGTLLTNTKVGTSLYSSPEVTNQQGYNQKCDIWSLGVVIYELCSLQNPFNRESLNDLNDLTNKSNAKKLTGRIPLRYSQTLSHLIDKMIVHQPNNRIDIEQILIVCRHQGMKISDSYNQKSSLKNIQFPQKNTRWVNLKLTQLEQNFDIKLDASFLQSRQPKQIDKQQKEKGDKIFDELLLNSKQFLTNPHTINIYNQYSIQDAILQAHMLINLEEKKNRRSKIFKQSANILRFNSTKNRDQKIDRYNLHSLRPSTKQQIKPNLRFTNEEIRLRYNS